MKPAKLAQAVLALALLTWLALPGAAAATRTTIWVEGPGCPGCAAAIESALRAVAGVRALEPRFDQGQIVVEHDDQLATAALVDAVVLSGFRAGLDRQRLKEPNLLEGFNPSLDVKVVVRAGEDADLTAALAAGKVTVIDFFATWCIPCRAVERELARLLARDPGLAVRRVNVFDWSTPIAKRYLTDIDRLPFLQVFDSRGKLVAELVGPATRDLERVIARARGDAPAAR